MILTSDQIKRNITWLLGNSSAPVKYLTHKHLLATPVNSPLMKELWQEVENCQDVQEIYSKQAKNGSWCDGGSWAPGPSYALRGGRDPYSPKYVTTVWILPLLGEIGFMARDERIRKACAYVLANGHFLNPVFNEPIAHISPKLVDFNLCSFGQYLVALGAVGFTEDVKVKKGYKVLLCMQREDGGWVWPEHYNRFGWTRSCPWSTYHAVTALYYSKDPDHRDALVKGLECLARNLSLKLDHELQRFFYHGHSTIRELIMFSEFGIGLREKAIQKILEWLMTMYNAGEGFYRYAGKPISKYSRRKDGMEPRIAKYRLYHLIEDDWFTYHMTRIGLNLQKFKKKTGTQK